MTGVYLHGSAAMGCFNPKKSDLDFLLVVEREVSDEAKLEFMNHVVELNREGPAKGLELSVIRREYCNPVVYPTPFELHFSGCHLNWFEENPGDYIRNMKGVDRDLAAHFVVVRTYGKVLFGEEIRAVFGEVNPQDYFDSILRDISGARREIGKEPMYMTLNLCRVLAWLRDGSVLSKKAGGEWGVKYLPERFGAIVREALDSYGTEKSMEVNGAQAEEFADYMLKEIAGQDDERNCRTER